MSRIVFGTDCTSLEAVHDAVQAGGLAPAHYGRNLDALFDVLTTLPAVAVYVSDVPALALALGDRFEVLVRVLTDAAAAHAGVVVHLNVTPPREGSDGEVDQG